MSQWYGEYSRVVESQAPAQRTGFPGIDDEAWLWLNTTGRRRRKAVAPLLPEMPEVSVQETYTGSSGDQTLREGFNAYRLFKRCYESYVGPLGTCCGILDFGCGWGRIIRFFLKDVEPHNLTRCRSCPTSDSRICQQTNKWCKFTLTDPHSPCRDHLRVFWPDLSIFSVFTLTRGNALDAAQGIPSPTRSRGHINRHNQRS